MTDQHATQQVCFAVENAIVETAAAYHHVVSSIGEWEDEHPNGAYHMELWIEPEQVPPKLWQRWYKDADDEWYGVCRINSGFGLFTERIEFYPSPEFIAPNELARQARINRQVRILDGLLGRESEA